MSEAHIGPAILLAGLLACVSATHAQTARLAEPTGALTLSTQSQLSVDTGFALALGINATSVPLDNAGAGYEAIASRINPLPFAIHSTALRFAGDPSESLAFGDITPVPEPSTWLAAFFAFTLLAWQQRRRFRFGRPAN